MDIRQYLTNLLYSHYANKYTRPIKDSMPYKKALLQTLSFYPGQSSKVIKALTSAEGFQGSAASALQYLDQQLQKYGQDLYDRLNNSLTADQTLLDTVDGIISNTVNRLASGGEGMLMSAAVAIDGAAVDEFGLNIPADAIALLVTGVTVAAAGGIISRANVDIYDSMQTWVGQQKQIGSARAIPTVPAIIIVPMTKPVVPSGVQLPHWPNWEDTPPNEQQAIRDSFGDLINAGVPEDLILYLINLYGSMSFVKIAAMLRCLLRKGYINPRSQLTGRNALNDQTVSGFEGAWNSLTQHLTPADLEGAWKDGHGLVSNAMHDKEVQNAVDSLYKLMRIIERQLNRGVSSNLQQILQNMRDACQRMIDYVNKNVYGIKQPTDWPSNGFGPSISQVLKSSGCINATAATYPP
ncbi:MAG: hypothetical protein M3Z08_15925 [Chloroflexota bacterium]|nr:hypothetical protein [Chloroflexota bacterium]